ncbi:MAG TPA: hypothetical protein VHX92_09205 [Rhizomicrobium sp.]|nr:hypothetical protein [Rhizomicrobium sp.]
MVIAEIAEGLTGIKTALDILKGLKKSQATGGILTEIADLQTALIEVQQGIMAANQTHTADIDRIRELEKEVATLKAWGTEKERYELKQIDAGYVAYMLKPSERGGDPPHWLCATCYSNGQKAFVQAQGRTKDGIHLMLECGTCGAKAAAHWNTSAHWL